jgi:hypothetical protein
MYSPVSLVLVVVFVLVLKEKVEDDGENEDKASFTWIVGPISRMHPPFLLKKQLVCA